MPVEIFGYLVDVFWRTRSICVVLLTLGACTGVEADGTLTKSAPANSWLDQIVGSKGNLINTWRRAGGSEKSRRVAVVFGGSGCAALVDNAIVADFVPASLYREVLLIEKPGISPTAECDLSTLINSTEEMRWADAANYLQWYVDHSLFTPEFDLFAVSSGGLTACAIASNRADVKNLVLLSTGGGIPFSEELAILTNHDATFLAQMRRIMELPQPNKTWLGDDNGEIWWHSALAKSCAIDVPAINANMLIVHGRRDTAVPLVSASRLAELAKAREGAATDFLVVDEEHDLGLHENDRSKVGLKIMSWLQGEHSGDN